MKKAAILSAVVIAIGVAFGSWWLRSRVPAPETASELAAGAPVGAVDAAPPGASVLQPEAAAATDAKIIVLREILAARNDGDPRLDTDFKNLSPETKERMRAEYRTLAPEKLNEKGTIMFLLGRNLVNEVDFDFVDDVLKEPACRSQSDCGRAPAASTAEESHAEAGTAITLAYPQLVAIKSLERMLEDGTTPAGLTPEIQKRLEAARRSTVPVVARQAEEALSKTTGS